MKLSVSLPEEDVAVLDAYVARAQLSSRSAGLQRAVQMLRYPDLENNYHDAWREWAAEGDVWEAASGDGVDNAAR